MWRILSLTTLLGVVVITACQPISIETGEPLIGATNPAFTQAPERSSQGTNTPERSKEIMTKVPERIQPTPEMTPVTGEVPQGLLDSILKDLTERSSVSIDKISVIQAQEIIWPDGSLGCPQPGMMYTQAIVDGYRVILQVGEKQYDYHASKTGFFFLCENSIPSNPLSGTPDS